MEGQVQRLKWKRHPLFAIGLKIPSLPPALSHGAILHASLSQGFLRSSARNPVGRSTFSTAVVCPSLHSAFLMPDV